MSKKALIFGIFVALIASSVGGAFTASMASADSIYPYGGLTCVPGTQTANSGDLVNFTAYYTTPYGQAQNGQFTWQAVGGYPSTGSGQWFSTRFYTSSLSETRVVTVTDGYQSASCSVYLNGSATPTPTPYYNYVSINHTVRNITRGGEGTSVTAYNGDRLQFVVTLTTANQYAYNVYLRDWLPQYVSYVAGTTSLDGVWYNDGVTTSSLSIGTLVPNHTYTLRFEGTVSGAYNGSLTNTVNLHIDGATDQSRTSTISVVGSWYTPTPTVTPVYTNVSLTEFGRNVSRGQSGEYTAVVARGSETLDIVVHVRANSTSSLNNIFVTNILPSGLNYIARSTTINGVAAADGITTSGLNIGYLSSGQEAVVKFSVTIDPNSVPSWGQVDLRNTTQVRADNLSTMSVQLPITLGNSVSIAAISSIKTGPADSIILSLIIGALVTAMYALYTRSTIFGRRFALSEIRHSMNVKSSPNFVR